jgi:8-oxo-dGTP pyrophosphatase MutT (NUDIX family)
VRIAAVYYLKGNLFSVRTLRKQIDQATLRRLLAEPESEQEIPEGSWKRAAVLALILPGPNGEEILFTRRTDTVLDHKGQVSFPGGAVEPEDNSLEETALREAREEIGLDPNYVTLLGRSRDMFTITGWWITPVIGYYSKNNGFLNNPAEVSRVFTLPINWLARPTSWEKRMYIKDDRVRENVIFYHQYDGEILWGVTAHLVHDLLRKLRMME